MGLENNTVVLYNSLDVETGVVGTPLEVAGALVVTPVAAPTATRTNVAQSAVTVVILAANVARLGATVFNDPSNNSVLFLNFAATAALTDFTVRLTRNGYFEVPFRYTGTIAGIWASAGAGAARVTELT